jgi:hypothetical protein
MTAPYDDLGSLDEWLLKQAIAQADSGSDIEDQLVPTSVETLGKPCAHLYATLMFDGEVANGGMQQFFDSSSGVLAPLVLEAMRQMQLASYANALSQIIDAFGPTYPRHSWDRSEMIDTSVLLQQCIARAEGIIDVWGRDFILARQQYARRSNLIR